MNMQKISLRCQDCGSPVLTEIALNQFKCNHCGAITLVKDTISDRLDKVLDQVKDAAAERLANEEAMRRETQRKVLFAISAAVLVGAFLLVAFSRLINSNNKTARPAGTYEAVKVNIDGTKLVVVDAKQVVLGSGSSANAGLLLNVRNDTGVALDNPNLKIKWYEADQLIGETSAKLQRDVMLPGESAPVIFEAPSGKSFSRYEIEKSSLQPPRNFISQGSLKLDAMRFLRQDKSLLVVGRLKNTTTLNIKSVRLYAVAKDSSSKVIAFGDRYFDVSELAADKTAFVKVELKTLGDLEQVKTMEYVVAYEQLAEGRYSPVASLDRVMRIEQAAQTMSEWDISPQELLADESQRFDLKQLQLKPLQAARDDTQDLVYLSEITNLSTDTIAIKPGAVVRSYNGAQLGNTTSLKDIPDLYPGESFPVLIDPRDQRQLTKADTEFKPILKTAMPGTRPRLEIKLGSTEAKMGSVNVNFTRNYRYKYVEVSGQIRNASAQPVVKPVLWLMLRDSSGALSGFKRIDNIAPIPPGESVPFKADITQMGHDFVKIDTLYSTR